MSCPRLPFDPSPSITSVLTARIRSRPPSAAAASLTICCSGACGVQAATVMLLLMTAARHASESVCFIARHYCRLRLPIDGISAGRPYEKCKDRRSASFSSHVDDRIVGRRRRGSLSLAQRHDERHATRPRGQHVNDREELDDEPREKQRVEPEDTG